MTTLCLSDLKIPCLCFGKDHRVRTDYTYEQWGKYDAGKITLRCAHGNFGFIDGEGARALNQQIEADEAQARKYSTWGMDDGPEAS